MVGAVKEDVLRELVKMRVRQLFVEGPGADSPGHSSENTLGLEGEFENFERAI
jgi:hypothetical protein